MKQISHRAVQSAPGALGYDARPEYNKSTAKKCRKAAMDMLVCTPERLAECMGEFIRG